MHSYTHSNLSSTRFLLFLPHTHTHALRYGKWSTALVPVSTATCSSFSYWCIYFDSSPPAFMCLNTIVTIRHYHWPSVRSFVRSFADSFRHTAFPYISSFCFRRSENWIKASVKKMVQPTGIATATKFLPIPRVRKEYPNSRCNDRTVSTSDWLVLNISFRMTSSGLVKAAPAMPAAALL